MSDSLANASACVPGFATQQATCLAASFRQPAKGHINTPKPLKPKLDL
jgi:hypothetical protein